MEEKEVILTQEGYDKIEKELEFLRTEKRTENIWIYRKSGADRRLW